MTAEDCVMVPVMREERFADAGTVDDGPDAPPGLQTLQIATAAAGRPVDPAAIQRRPFLLRAGEKLRPYVDRMIARSSQVSNSAVLDAALFPWTKVLRENWGTIRREALAVIGKSDDVPQLGAVSPNHARIAKDERWRSFFLVGYGQRIERNIALSRDGSRAGTGPRVKQRVFLRPAARHAHSPPSRCHQGVAHMPLGTSGADRKGIAHDRSRAGRSRARFLPPCADPPSYGTRAPIWIDGRRL